MRYSRWKKQMDRAQQAAQNNPIQNPPPSPRKRNNAPKRSRVEKNESPKKNKRGSIAAKMELQEEGSDREGSASNTGMMMGGGGGRMGFVKQERPHHQHQHRPGEGSESLMTPLPSESTHTPRYCIERSASPSPSLATHQMHTPNMCREHETSHSFNTLDDFATSFDIGSQGAGVASEGLFGEVMASEQSWHAGMGIGLGMSGGLDGSFEGLWDASQGQGQSQGSGVGAGGQGVLVKTEERWEDGYRHV